MFERLVARAMDSVRAIREGSQDVGALVTCGPLLHSGHYTEPNSSGDLGQPFAVTGKLTGLLGSPLEHSDAPGVAARRSIR